MEDDGKCQFQLLMYRCDFLNDGLKELQSGKKHISQYSYQEVKPAIHFARFTAYSQVSMSHHSTNTSLLDEMKNIT